MIQFERRFGSPPARKATLLTWEKRAFITGSAKDSSRLVVRLNTFVAVAGSIEQITSIITMASTKSRLDNTGQQPVAEHKRKSGC
ncbi:hypothetical protein ANN_11576 [Periplaneta americana]|uniref:DUF4817 domain-containing protein n=1 Tax=Periplaneta americana TaxID=6978 RepID=A0ABQ8T5E5_PERAM|nr:hypothetical protein ANN_11576 [Periplaneta americana]